MALLRLLASPKLVVVFFVLTALGALSAGKEWVPPTFGLLFPIGLLVVSIVAAILTHPRFRSDLPLLVLHLALISLVVLFAIGRLTYLYGSISVTRDTLFNGVIDQLEQGPLHDPRFRQLRFVHAGVTEKFKDEIGHHVEIRSRIRWQSDQGEWRETELGFGYPVILNGYRIYPSGRRGYSPIFQWQGDDGRQDVGTVQLFGTAEQVAENSNSWFMPNGVKAWLQLESFAPNPPPKGLLRTDLDAAQLPHKLILRIDDDRHELKLGETVKLAGGKLTYLKLESWGGYSLIYDPTEYWLIATIMVAVASLAWLYLRQFTKRSPVQP